MHLAFSWSVQQWDASIDQRMARVDQAMREEVPPSSVNDQGIRDRLRTVEGLKQQVKVGRDTLFRSAKL